MSITVKEVMKMKGFESFTLAAGEKGLGREISNVGVLDYEYANEDPKLEALWTFGKDAFVISSLLFAKDHPERILAAVKGLCRDGVSVLAIKTIYYKNLPQEVLEYAEQQAFPIYTFGRDDAYFENIVVSLKNKIAESDNAELIEQKIFLLLSKTLTMANILTLTMELMPDAPRTYCAIRYMPMRYSMALDFNHIKSVLQNSLQAKDYLFQYKNGHIVVMNLENEKSGEPIKNIVQKRMRFPRSDFIIGVSNIHHSIEEMNYALEESIHAAQYGAMNELTHVNFKDMGIYKILMPYSSDPWMKAYCLDILEPILKFDRTYNGELFKTAQLYVQYGGDAAQVGEQLHLHKNTVRYRMKKIKELLEVDEEANIDDQLSIAFRVFSLQSASSGL